MRRYGVWVEDVPTNATGVKVVGTGDDDSTVVVKKKPKVYKRKKRMTEKEIEEARNYAKERENYHSKPEQMERNAARLRARRLMIKNGKAARGDGKDVHHKDNNPLNNEDDNLAMTDPSWNRREPRLRKEWGDTSILSKQQTRISGRPNLKSFQVKTAKHKRGKISVKDFKDLEAAKTYLELMRKKGHNGIISQDGKPIKEEESINISERSLTDTELKRREEIAKDLDDEKFKEKYGDRWKQVKMGVATNMAKKESIEEADDPKADNAKAKELKIAKAIAQAQLAIAKEQERVQKLTDLQNKVKDQQTEETTMSKKYLNTKQGSIEDVIKQVWQNAADAVPAAPPTVENWKDKEDEVDEDSKWSDGEKASLKKVDGRTKQYRETLKRIAIRKEKLNTLKKSSKKVEHVTDAIDEEDDLDEAKFSPKDIKKAIKIAYDMEGNMTGAHKKIEKMKRGLGDEPTVQAALQDANEETIHELYSVEFTFKSDRDAKAAASFVEKNASPGKLETDISGKVVEFYLVGKDDTELKSVKAEVEQKFKRQLTGTKVQNEDFIHEAVKGHFDAQDPGRMKKSLSKHRLKGKISQKNVNPGQDEWEVSGKSIEDIWKWYIDDYGDKDDFDDMDDFKDTHFESRIHHRAMMTEGNKEEYQKFFQAALKKFGAKSPADMDDEKKKKFFDYIDKNWTKEEQQEFTEGELPPALKKAIAAKKASKKNGDEEDEDKDPVGDKKEKKGGKPPWLKKKEGFGESIDELRKISDSKAHGRVNDVKIDIHSANAMVRVFDQLSAGNKLKVEQMLKSPAGVNKFAEFAISNIKK